MSFIRRLSKSQLVRGSILVFIGNNIASFGNFLYNLSMARLLGPERYGDLGAILSIFILLGVPLGILNLMTVKTVSSYWGKKAYGSIANFLAFFTPRLFILGVGFSGVLLLGSSVISRFLNLDSYLPILIVAASFILSVPSTLCRATLVGTLSFSYLTINSFIEVTLKLILSLILVILNFGLIGALLGPLIGGLMVYLLVLVELKIILGGIKATSPIIKKWRIADSLKPIFFATLALAAFFNLDVILVRHFFEAGIAGEYVALATTGRIIYYAVGPIIAVMFPIISSRASRGTPYILPLLGTLVLSLGLAAVLISAYFLFPKFIISILFGRRYFGVIPYLGLFSLFITIYTVNSILTHFLLSTSYYKPIFPLFLISLFQGIFIFFFHSSITQVIWVNILTSLVYFLVISLFVVKREYGIIVQIIKKLSPWSIYGG